MTVRGISGTDVKKKHKFLHIVPGFTEAGNPDGGAPSGMGPSGSVQMVSLPLLRRSSSVRTLTGQDCFGVKRVCFGSKNRTFTILGGWSSIYV